MQKFVSEIHIAKNQKWRSIEGGVVRGGVVCEGERSEVAMTKITLTPSGIWPPVYFFCWDIQKWYMSDCTFVRSTCVRLSFLILALSLHANARKRSQFFLCSFEHARTHARTHALTHKHTHERTYAWTHKHTHTLSLSVPLALCPSLSHTLNTPTHRDWHIHTFTFATRTHTHTHTPHTHTHTPGGVTSFAMTLTPWWEGGRRRWNRWNRN